VGLSDLLRRGLAAGAAAGLAAAVVLYLLVEPVIRKALVIEEARGVEATDAHSHTHGADEAEPLVSRTMQVIGGMGTAIVVGCLFGIAFSVVFARSRHRLYAASGHGQAVTLAALGFLVFSMLPALKIPSNPPAVGDPDTVTRRTLIYVLTIMVTLALVLAVFALDRLLAGRGFAGSARSSLDVVAFVAGAVALLALLPGTPDQVPHDVPAGLVWEFRLASLAQLGAMWGTLGLVFGLLVSPRAREARAEVVAA
jgi:predicted cobalt transporter CbtA